jgi:hypothetical protein
MADVADIARLRLMLGPNVLDDTTLGDIIDATDSTDLLEWTATAWEAVAARYHSLVNISESGSSRQMGDMYKNALGLAAAYRKRLDAALVVEEETVGRSTTRRITRL